MELLATTAAEPSELEAPNGRIADADFIALAKRCAAPYTQDLRKLKAHERWLIFTEDHRALILRRLDSTLNDKAYLEEVSKFVDVTANPALDVVKDTSVVWRLGAQRSIADASESEASALTELITESLIDVHAPQWNRLAEFLGPLIIVPTIRKEKLRWDCLLPTYYDVLPDPDDPHGDPLAVAWPIRSGPKSAKRADLIVLDGHSWRHVSTAGGRANVVDEVEHGLGFFPGATLRFDTPCNAEWHGQPTRNQRLVDATIDVGGIRAQMGVTRKAQNSKLLTAIGYLGDGAKQQTLDPETGIAINVDVGVGKSPPTVQTLDFDTPPKNFHEQSDGTKREVAGAYGGTVNDKGKIVFDVDALTEIRNGQIPHARAFEMRLWFCALSVCAAMKHPLFARLPKPAKVTAGFAVDFGELSRTFADPESEAAHWDWRLSKGAVDQLDILRAQGNQNLDDKQLRKKLEKNLENQAWFNDAVTKRNLNMGAKQNVQTAAQAFGALGPVVRDAANEAPEGAPAKPDGEAEE